MYEMLKFPDVSMIVLPALHCLQQDIELTEQELMVNGVQKRFLR